jgi:hypothetical protein
MQLKLQRKIDKLKKKLKDSKTWQLTSSSLSNEEIDDSSEEKVKGKGKRGRKEDKRYYNTNSFNYDNLPPSNGFTSVPVGKAPPPTFRWDGLYQMEILDEGASNLAQSEHLDNCAYMC